jgi:hypothetical protein
MGLSYEPFLVYPCCIYCLTTEGEFTEEHPIPESLGNQGDQAIVLPKEYTCRHCNNNILSPLDQELIDYTPIGFFRVHFVSYSKKGKRPKAGFQNMSLYKEDDDHISYFIKDKSGLPRNLKKRSNNEIEYEMLVRGKRNFQPKYWVEHFIKLASECSLLSMGRIEPVASYMMTLGLSLKVNEDFLTTCSYS